MITDPRKYLKRAWLKIVLARLLEDQREANRMARELPEIQADIACDIAQVRCELMELRK